MTHNIHLPPALTETFDIIRAKPGITYEEGAKLCKVRSGAFQQRVKKLRERGCVNAKRATREPLPGEKVEHAVSIVQLFPVDPETMAQQAEAKRAKEKVSKEAQSLNEELTSLREFKRMALARYPDLAVPPAVALARRHCAKVMETLDPSSARDFLAGRRDGTPMMKAVVALYEEVGIDAAEGLGD